MQQNHKETQINKTITNDERSQGYVDGISLLNKSTESFFEEKALRKIRLNNIKNVIIGQLNINSIRNKFEDLKLVITNNVDIFLVSETKINEPFPENQFKIKGYSRPYRLDRNEYGGGLLLYVRQDIPSKLVRKEKDYEAFFVEVNLKKQIWLVFCLSLIHI